MLKWYIALVYYYFASDKNTFYKLSWRLQKRPIDSSIFDAGIFQHYLINNTNKS